MMGVSMALAGNGGPLTAPNFFELTPAERGRLTGGALQEALTASGRGERAFWREYLVDSGLTYNALHGRLWRARKGITTEAPKWDIGKPLELDIADCIVFGDVHLPMASNEWIANMLMVAEKKLKKGRRVGFLVGDMMNGFTLMLDGYPTVFGPEPFTNWDKWK